eukprot:CAMPEP_0198284408 /NCGR_PEP_ID=MMETSP1449-20131203/3881_1 /TAXON_ID=420275 /ORGANISM="Attheya septentrionalis, Strain CCMP2084" /LENGTH=531 /DNA_ID=CAMNT_0043981457 /DNA_START=86 /DNA_END=1681 /DNA_ORIENTATION=+
MIQIDRRTRIHVSMVLGTVSLISLIWAIAAFSDQIRAKNQRLRNNRADNYIIPHADDYPSYPSPKFPSFTPKESPRNGLITGRTCSSDEACASGRCHNGACYASQDCRFVKHAQGTPFDTQRVNLVFVGSGFDTATHRTWNKHVNTIFSSFSKFNMFSKTNSQFNAFYVDILEPSFCDFGCHNSNRLLCCNIQRAYALAAQCVPEGPTRQVIVIQNDKRYGGAGYSASNIATTSIHPSAPQVALHELGHSLFDLADEYPTGNGDGELHPNCDLEGCAKWSDLIDHNTVLRSSYGSVSCDAGCESGNHFVGRTSFMGSLKSPMGAVNERYTCCTYLALTGAMPTYCNIFEFAPNYLKNFCYTNDFQGYYDNRGIASDALFRTSNPSNSFAYVTLQRPELVEIVLDTSHSTESSSLLSDSCHIQSITRKGLGDPGVYPLHRTRGTFQTLEDAVKAGAKYIIRVTGQFQNGQTNVLYFSDETRVHVPPDEDDNDEATNPTFVVTSKIELLELAFETSDDLIMDSVVAEVVNITT